MFPISDLLSATKTYTITLRCYHQSSLRSVCILILTVALTSTRCPELDLQYFLSLACASKICEELLLFLRDGVVLVSGRLWYLVKPASVEVISQVRHPGCGDVSLENSLPVYTFKPFMALDRCSILNRDTYTSLTPSRYLTSGLRSLRIRSFERRLRNAGN